MNPILTLPVTLALAAGLVLAAPEWRPIDPADLAAKTPTVDKDADAEALFWDVWVLDELDGGELHSVLDHYVRVKIFTERGKETQGKVDILSAGRTRIAGITGRTIKPDGSILELDKNSVFDRVLAQVEGFRVRAKSFAMPGVGPGAIIEYRWRETRVDQVANYVRLQYQRDVPSRRVTYHVKPLRVGNVTIGMNSIRFHMPAITWVKESGGYSSATLTDVPAFQREPDMPPDDQVRAWVLVYYTMRDNVVPEKYWQEFGRDRYRVYKGLMKVDGEIKAAAAKAVEGAQNDEEKLKRLFDYCRAQVKNKYDPGAGLSSEERAALKQNKTPADTLRQGYGNSREIDLLFATLAAAAGFDARFALVADRGDAIFNRGLPDSYFLNSRTVAVRTNDKWLFLQPSSTHLPFGMLDWRMEGADALIPDPKEPTFVKTPISGTARSAMRRKAILKLDARGAIEGDVTVEYTGHRAAARRQALAGDSAEEQSADLAKSVQALIPSAVVTGIKIENAPDAEKPVIETYHIRLPGYAQRTGKRLLLPLAFFQRGVAARFPTSARQHPIFFRYPWLEQDQLLIEMPEGFETENAEAPQPIRFAPVGEYNVSLGITRDKRKLVYTRALAFGANGQMFYDPKHYPGLKKVFDAIHEQDQHIVGLKASEAKP
jgi:transglutaminase-like putative cysteine protease